ncbi:unannotated protein [freshwater metagenome]|uniref:Unannotated protein n=1 Tax=freshwater metagenome TaxID=449393 RepID=A0A6J7CC53_9ZZZZ
MSRHAWRRTVLSRATYTRCPTASSMSLSPTGSFALATYSRSVIRLCIKCPSCTKACAALQTSCCVSTCPMARSPTSPLMQSWRARRPSRAMRCSCASTPRRSRPRACRRRRTCTSGLARAESRPSVWRTSVPIGRESASNSRSRLNLRQRLRRASQQSAATAGSARLPSYARPSGVRQTRCSSSPASVRPSRRRWKQTTC